MSLRNQYRAHLDRLGFALGESRMQRLERLRRHIGDERLRRCIELARDPVTKYGPEICQLAPDLSAANLLRSLDGDVALEASVPLYERSVKYLRLRTRVIELGCYTGALASFIAARHPDCEVIGVDRTGPYVRAANAHYGLDNLRFVEWDYDSPKPADLPPADLLICALGIRNSAPGKYSRDADPHCLRGQDGFRREREEAASVLRNWRECATDGARLIGVLRLANYTLMLAFMDAATQSGWAPDLNVLAGVTISGEEWPVPLVELEARVGGLIPEDDVLSHWMALNSAKEGTVDVHGGAALALFRLLPDPVVLASREVSTPNGLPTREEVGTAGPWGYILLQDTRPGFRLKLIPAAAAREHAKRPGTPAPAAFNAFVLSLAGVPEGSSITVVPNGRQW